MQDYYAILGVSERAEQVEIKKAYRTLARQWHPDKKPDDPRAEEIFKRVTRAYLVLVDPEKRRKYDALRRRFLDPAPSIEEIAEEVLNDFREAVDSIIEENELAEFLELEEDGEAEAEGNSQTREEIAAELLKEAADDPELREYLRSLQVLPKDISL